ncbi:MAG: histidine phosphatase family protein [Chloroflexota bacterium]
MNQIVLIRHSITNQDANSPSSQWRLSHAGRQKCEALSEQLVQYKFTKIISSHEPKAIETAELTTEFLGISTEVTGGLQEHMRDTVGYIESREMFNSKVKELFENPDEIVFGSESANQARERLAKAIDNLVKQYPDENLGIVTHGTVMSLFICEHNSMNAREFWGRLKMPAYVVLFVPEYELIDITYSI